MISPDFDALKRVPPSAAPFSTPGSARSRGREREEGSKAPNSIIGVCLKIWNLKIPDLIVFFLMNGVIFTMFLSWPVGGEILKFEINQWWHRHGSSALGGFFRRMR